SQRIRPIFFSTVTPGKFPTRDCSPANALNRVLLPVFGLPIIATVSVCDCWARGCVLAMGGKSVEDVAGVEGGRVLANERSYGFAGSSWGRTSTRAASEARNEMR